MRTKRALTGLLLLTLLAGCAARPTAPRAVPSQPPTPAPAETAALPSPLSPAAPTGHVSQHATSPDGHWNAQVVDSDRTTGSIWLESEQAAGDPWLVARDLYPTPTFLWTPRSTLLFYRHYGQDERDTWFEADPVNRTITRFVPGLLAHQAAGQLSFSPDGRRLLVTTGNCIGCNKPSAVTRTTYVIDLVTQQWQEVGVDVNAQWDGDQLAVKSQAPGMGYSGSIFDKWDTNHEVATVHGPLSFSIQVGGAESAEVHIYPGNAKPSDPPLRIMPASNWQSSYSDWGIWWGDPPLGLLKIELWAEVRPTVADDPQFRHEAGKRWAVVFTQVVKVLPGDQPRQTLLLRGAHMWDTRNGWGVGARGRILRTADGGATWRDVSPTGLAQCAGRLSPRQVESFAQGSAGVALACDRTDATGKWSPVSGQVNLFHSTDSAATWQVGQIDTGYKHANPTAIRFLNDHEGWVLVQPQVSYMDWTDEGTLYHTTDGGRSWHKVADTASGLPAATDLSFLTPERGWMPCRKPVALCSTSDGGHTWTPVPIDTSDFGTDHPQWVTLPQFVSATTGFFTVRGPKQGNRLGLQILYATTDGGQTWAKRSSWDGERRPIFLTPQVGYIWEYEFDTVYWTRDGGQTWEPHRWENNQAGIGDVHFVDEQRGFAVQGHFWTTADGARTWTPIYPNIAP